MKKSDEQINNQEIDTIMVSAVQVQAFKQQFSDIGTTIKLFASIEQQFIKRYRLKNQQNVAENQFYQFVKAFRQTLKYYDSYQQYIQTTLEKYLFCNKLKKFARELYKSQKKIITFFTCQIQFHSIFIRQKQEQYKKSLENLKITCNKCKQIQNKTNIKNTQEKLHFPFNNHFKMYKDLNCNQFQINKIEQNQLNYDLQQSNSKTYDISSAQIRLKKIIQQNKKGQISAFSDIIDMFQKKEEAQFNTVNKFKINQMFYQLQNELQNRSLQIQQYIQDLQIFNQKLINYNPHLSSKYQSYEQTQPNIVEKQLKYNLQKIIKKIYKKITQLIQKRKDQSLSKHVQVNFTQDHVIKQLEKQKKKLTIDLKQCQQEKEYTTNALKSQIQRLSSQLKIIQEEKIKLQIVKDEYFSQKQGLARQNYQLTKIIEQLKKQIDKLKKNQGKQAKIQTKQFFQQKNLIKKEQAIQKQINDQDQKKYKQEENALIYEFQQRQQELLRKLQMKNKREKRGFFAPRKSKVLQVINLQEVNVGGLKKVVSRFSKDINKEEININDFEDKKQEMSFFFQQHQTPQNQTPQNAQTVNHEQQNEQENNLKISNVQQKKMGAKTSTKIQKEQNQVEIQKINSDKCISQTSEDVHRQLKDLQQLKKFKLIQNKINKMKTKNRQNQLFQNIQNCKQQFFPNQQTQQNIQNNDKNNLISEQSEFQKNQRKKQSSSIASITSQNYMQIYDDYLKKNQIQITRAVQTQELSEVIYKILYQYQIENNKFNPNILTFNAFKFGYDEFLNQITNLILKQQKNPIRKLNMYKGSSFILKKSHNYRFNKKQFLNTFSTHQKQKEEQKRFYVPPKYNQNYKQDQVQRQKMSKTANNYSCYQNYREILQKTQQNGEKTNKNLTFKTLAYKTISDLKTIQKQKNPKLFSKKSNEFISNSKLKRQTFHQSTEQNINYLSNKKCSQTLHKEFQIKERSLNEFIKKQDIEGIFFDFQTAKRIQQKKQDIIQVIQLNNLQIHFTTEFLAVLASIHLLSVSHYQQIKNIFVYPSKYLQNGKNNNSLSLKDDLDLKSKINYLVFMHRKCETRSKLKQLINKKQQTRKGMVKIQKQTKSKICSHLKEFLIKMTNLIQHLKQLKIHKNDGNLISSKIKITSIQNMTQYD